MKKNNFSLKNLICALVAACIVFTSFAVPMAAKADGTKITGPIDITFDTSILFASKRLTGNQVTRLMSYAGITNFNKREEPWYVDSGPSYTCLVKRNAEEYPGYWDVLFKDEELLDENAEYYFRFEIENGPGHVFDLENLPAVTINGAAPDFITYPSSEDSLIDAFVRATFDEVTDACWGISFDRPSYLVQRGTSKKFPVSVEGTSDGVTYTLEAHSSADTKVDPDGTVHIGADEIESSIVVTVTSVCNPSIFAKTTAVCTNEALHTDAVSVGPYDPAKKAYRGTSVGLTKTYTGTDDDYITLEIVSPVSSENTYVSYWDTLYIGDDETATSITIRATSVADPSVTSEYVLEITPITPITGLIDITFNQAALGVNASSTGESVTAALFDPAVGLPHFGSENAVDGWYIDSGASYTCLVKKTDPDPYFWTRLGYDTTPLEQEEGLYYICLEVEDYRGQGYDWDSKCFPEFRVNGKPADAVVYGGNYCDVYVLLDMPGVPQKTLSSIAFNGDPQTKYTEGDSLRYGFKIEAEFTDGTKEDVTGLVQVTPNRLLVPADTEGVYSFTYRGVTKTLTNNITVKSKNPATCKVTFDPRNGEAPVVKDVKQYEHVPYPDEDPAREHLIFYKWYVTNSDGTETPFDFGSEITADTTVFAKYVCYTSASVYPSYGGLVSSASHSSDKSGFADMTVEEMPTSYTWYTAYPADGYVLKDWRLDSENGPLVGTNPDAATYYSDPATNRVLFRLDRGDYKFCAIFELAPDPVYPDHLVIDASPSNPSYTAGESFDKAGLKVNLIYTDGSKTDVTGKITVTGGFPFKADDTSVEIAYTEGETTLTAKIPVTVKKAAEPAIETPTGSETEAPSETPSNTGSGEEPTPTPAGETPGNTNADGTNPGFTTKTLPAATAGKPYSTVIEITGDKPVTATLAGDLPAGLRFNADNLELYGTPEKAGTYTVTVRLENSNGLNQMAYVLTVKKASNPAAWIIPLVLVLLLGAAAASFFLLRKKGLFGGENGGNGPDKGGGNGPDKGGENGIEMEPSGEPLTGAGAVPQATPEAVSEAPVEPAPETPAGPAAPEPAPQEAPTEFNPSEFFQ
ncbi:MAG: putative Ig domain-containing protein [Clostridia bacterium]|nr:putative Ig domain-containing protein [Clostridia bacterium]